MARTISYCIIYLLSLLLLLHCGGCGMIPVKMGPFEEKQLVIVNGKGELLQPVGNVSDDEYTSLKELDRKVELDEEDVYLQAVADGIFTQLENGKNVVVFIHGGMNTQFDTMKRAHNLLQLAEREDDVPYFVFINWQSSLATSYKDRLFSVREGKDFRTRGNKQKNYTMLTFPLYLLSDTLAGIARAPVTIERQLFTNATNRSFVSSKYLDLSHANDEFEVTRKCCLKNVTNPKNIQNVEDMVREVPSILTGPFRLFTIPFVDAYGTHAWDIMQRRTTILFNREINLKDGDEITDRRLNGPLYKFGEALVRAANKQKTNKELSEKGELSLIGHSMGTILGVELLRYFPEFHFDRIIFMAAACRVRDYAETVFPYLSLQENKKTVFYNLSLHPQAETREYNFFRLGPEGSLLVWIDQWFDKPDSILDRTAGRYVNLGMNARYLDREIESRGGLDFLGKRIFFKIFPYRMGYDPQVPMTHGSFDDFYFWEKSFWLDPKDPNSVTYKKYTKDIN